tara:strand:+ start:964 stop:1104 length:141 start_codon:yes stop_codon:yes gene_type:complete
MLKVDIIYIIRHNEEAVSGACFREYIPACLHWGFDEGSLGVLFAVQ